MSGEQAHKVRRIAHLDLPGAGQVEVQGDYAYIGHMDAPDGTTILDISDRKNPKVVSQIMLENDYSHTHKVRPVGDLMYTNVEQTERYYHRKADDVAALRASLEAEDKDASDKAIAAILNLRDEDVAYLDAAKARGYHDGGWKVWDISDKADPKLIKHVKNGGFGTHRFYADENYAYMSSEMEGYQGNILVIFDMADPANPKEVSHWWMPGQKVSAGEVPFWNGHHRRLHHALRFGDELWAASWHGGYWRIDVSDITAPKTLSMYDTNPPFIEPAHTLMPFAEPIDGRKIAIGIDEQHGQIIGQPPAGMWVFDVTDPAEMKPVSLYILSELDSPHSRLGGRFGAHQYHEKPIGTLIFATWFSGGLRIVDFADPEMGREVGVYMPNPCGGNATPQSNDVFVEHDTGLIHLVDRFCGYDILEWEEWG